MLELLEYLKMNGPWAVQFGLLLYLVCRAARWFALDVIDPLVKDLRLFMRVGCRAAIQLRDDVGSVKTAVARVEARQIAAVQPSA